MLERAPVFQVLSPPVSGAETLESDAAFVESNALEWAEVAAAEDGRSPRIQDIPEFCRAYLRETKRPPCGTGT